MKPNSFSINLTSILDLSSKLNDSVDINYILNSTLLSIMGKLGITRAAIFKKNQSNYELILQKGKCEIKSLENFEISTFKEINANNYSEKNLLNCDYRYIVPLRIANDASYFFALSKSITKERLEESEIEYVNLLSNIASIAIHNAENYCDLDIQKQKQERKNIILENLFQNARFFFSYFQSDDIISLLSYNLMGHLLINKLALILIDDDKEITIAKNKLNKDIDKKVINYSLSLNSIKLVQDIDDTLLKFAYDKLEVNVISPIYFKNKIRGAILIGKSMLKQDLNDEDKLFIEYIGNTAIAALENERLFQEEVKKKQLESELNLALDIQRGLFPSEPITLNSYSIYGKSLPSKQVGGDYYDHIKIDENRYFILIADVSGKGMPAAMIMANLQAALRVLVKLDLPLLDIILNLNYIVFSNTSQDKFVTFFGGILNIKENTFEYINAGHNPPLLFKKNELIRLEKGGLFLGLLEGGFPYESETITLENGDYILLYTDGITEAQNSKNEEFGEENLIQTCLDTKDPQKLLVEILYKIKDFTYSSSQYDDITLLCLIKK